MRKSKPTEATSPVLDPETPRATARNLRSALGVQIAGLGMAYLWALLCVSILDVLTWGLDVKRFAGIEVATHGTVLLTNALILFVLIVLLTALTNRLWLSQALVLLAAGLTGFANFKKLEVRREPLYPNDLSFARQTGFLLDMTGASDLLVVVTLLLVITTAVLWVGRRMGRVFPPLRHNDAPRIWWQLLVGRFIVAAACGAVLLSAMSFNERGNPVRALFENTGAKWAWWSQQVNYQRNGFIGGFLYNLEVSAMQQPSDYSAATMAALADKYTLAADEWNEGRGEAAAPPMNVVVVLSEAFSDPTEVEGVTIPDDPIPFTRGLMRTTTSGTMLAQYYGGGTANIEYELLTGMSLSQYEPQMNSPYQMMIPKYASFPSIAGYLSHLGYDTVAIHPYTPSFYKRSDVYPRIGIDTFISEKGMRHTDRIEKNEFISDAAAFAETLDQLRARDNPLFVNLVTMQNHWPMADKYADPWQVEGDTGRTTDQVRGYLRGLNYTDQAIKDFIGQLEALDEPTAVVFFGDHLPGIWDDAVAEATGPLGMRQTPFFFWTNFEQLPATELETTSPIYFLPLLFDGLDLPIPPYLVLLLHLHEEIAAMELGIQIAPDGNIVDEGDLSPRAEELLRDYRLVVYDLSVGKRYSQSALFYPELSVDSER